MKRHAMMGLAAALSWSLAATAGALPLVSNDKMQLDIHGRGQMIGVGEIVPDPKRDNARIYLFLKQARLGFTGRYEEVKFETMFAFGGENANGTNTDLGMLDFVADVPLKPLGEDTILKVGQFRVPFGREGLTDRGYMSFAERSIANMASYQGRDYGIALQKRRGGLIGTFGVFSGGGRDIPQRYLPEVLGRPETVLRFGYDDGVDEDIYHVKGTDLELKRTTKALYVNALYMQDTLIGHGTVMNLRTIDKNLLVNSSYNPYINAGPGRAAATTGTADRGDIWFVGVDGAVRKPLGGDRAIEGEAELVRGGYQNRYGVQHIAAARAQGALRVGRYAVGLRWAGLMMDKRSAYLSAGKYFSPAVGSVIHEITPSLTWHVKKHNLKLVADAPVYVNMPVYYDSTLGAYVFATQPDQVSVIAGNNNGTRRRTIPQARLMFQFMF